MAALERRGTIAKRPATKSAPLELADSLIGPYIAEGLFMKKSSKGKWQKRLFQLRGPYLMYFDSPQKVKKGIPKDSPDSAMPDAAIYLRNIASCITVMEDGGKIVMTSHSGNTLEFKAVSASDVEKLENWVELITTQIEKIDPAPDVAGAPAGSDDEDEDDADDTDNFTGAAAVSMSFTPEAELEDAAIKLQSLLRSKAAAKQVAGMKEAEEQSSAALKMQGAFRMKAAREQVATKKAEVAESMEHEGEVEKAGHSALGMAFQKRTFVLKPGSDGKWEICYYKGEKTEANKKGTISMLGASVKAVGALNFKITTPSKAFDCRVPYPENTEEWVSKITKAIEASK